MKNILLVCCAGMSTSLLVTKMNSAAKNMGIEAKIEAIPESELRNRLEGVQVILLGPQVRYLLNNIKKQAEPKGIKVDIVNTIDYGTMNGENVLKHALSLIQGDN